jgi:MFS family permease
MTSLRCQAGLNVLNFLIGAIQTAFGPFFSVYLTQQGWAQVDVGLALSIGTAAALVLQIPAGWMVDTIHYKRFSLAIAFIELAVSALMVIAAPNLATIVIAQVLHAFASCLLTPAIAALTLVVSGHEFLSTQLGSNGRYASLGSAFAAALLGAVAYYLSERSVFIVAAVLTLPALAALRAFRASDRVQDDHPALLHPRERRQSEHRPWHIFRDTRLQIFAACVLLFQLSNAAMLPLALNELSKRIDDTGFVVSASIIVPQAVVVLFSPWTGRMAQAIGRRPVLLAGFVALPLRGLLFVGQPDAVPLIMIEALDGVSATVFGLTMPLIAADLTERTGYLNLAIGWFALVGGLGATVSTTIAGWLADTMGASAAFAALTVAGLAALGLVWSMMPETRPVKPVRGQPAMATV